MLPTVGIDLGTTFSALAYVDAQGQPQVIRSAGGGAVTPSVVCFNGREAWVGDKATARKPTTPHDIHEFIKRDIGKPIDHTRAGHESGRGAEVAPYEIGGYKYGAAGLSAIILRYLKKQALRHFRALELTSETDDTRVAMRAVITVPAYFGEKERQETRLAGHAAGFDVAGILNEPTAAALAFGLMRRDDQTILVFDLGGGTFDVTVLQMCRGEAKVLATRGDNTLGGRDFDELLQRHLLEQARLQTRVEVDESRGFEIQRLATDAKHALSEAESYTVSFTHAGRDLDVAIQRRPPAGVAFDSDLFSSASEPSGAFYFEERSSNLLQHCRALCESVIDGVTIESPLGPRQARWSDIGEIVLAGGSCKMPMVADMLERLTRRRIRRSIEGFSYDTAISVGAALYGTHRERVHDVLSHGLGVKLVRNGREYVDFVMKKDSPIPQSTSRTYRAAERAILEVWEGESEEPDECVRRGLLELDNPAGLVTICMKVDADGCLRVAADYPPAGSKEMEIRNDLFDFRGRAADLAQRIQNLTINV